MNLIERNTKYSELIVRLYLEERTRVSKMTNLDSSKPMLYIVVKYR